MTPDPDFVEQILRHQVAHEQRAGWNQPSRLKGMFGHGDKMLRLHRVSDLDGPEAPETPVSPPGTGPGQQVERLQALAHRVAWPPCEHDAFFVPGWPIIHFRGWVFIGRAYRVPEDKIIPGVAAGDNPDGYETRVVVAVDLADVAYALCHRRGTGTVDVDRSDRDWNPDGLIYDAVRLLTIATAAQMPAGMHRMPPLPAHPVGQSRP